MTLRRTRQLVVSLGVGIVFTACHHGTSVGERAANAGGSGAITLEVVNHSSLDIAVYFLQGAHRDRVGTAGATSTTEFHVLLRRLSSGLDYYLAGEPVGSRRSLRSEPLRAQDGDVVSWTIEEDLARSFVDVR